MFVYTALPTYSSTTNKQRPSQTHYRCLTWTQNLQTLFIADCIGKSCGRFSVFCIEFLISKIVNKKEN